MKAFFDTNVLVYVVTSDPRKQKAQRVLSAGGIVSVQVLNEFANVAHRKLGHAWDEVEFALNQFRVFFDEVSPLTLDTHTSALVIARDHRLSFYDALVVASAIEAGCDILYSEDMQDGRTFGALAIRNPF
jgi:predicted nucleic acid-binding protein